MGNNQRIEAEGFDNYGFHYQNTRKNRKEKAPSMRNALNSVFGFCAILGIGFACLSVAAGTMGNLGTGKCVVMFALSLVITAVSYVLEEAFKHD